MTNSTFRRNSAQRGGALFFDIGFDTIQNGIFSDNTALDQGSAIFTDTESILEVTNSTFSMNSAVAGGGIYCVSSVPSFLNCVMWENAPSSIQYPGAAPPITYSIVQGGYAGAGNLNVDPLFRDLQNSDLSIRSVSPVIDAGTSTGAPSTDINGIARPQGPGYDMGAYEFIQQADSDGDGLPNADETGQGLDENTDDASLFTTIDYPSINASF
jgi:predicted outer membrane repeat protein